MSDWVNEWLFFSPFPFFFFTSVVKIHSCKSWKSCIGAILLLCEPRKGLRCQMESASMDWLQGMRYSSGRWRFWMLTLTEEGRPGGTFLIFFGCDSEGRKTLWNHLSMHTQTKNLTYCRIQLPTRGLIYAAPPLPLNQYIHLSCDYSLMPNQKVF